MVSIACRRIVLWRDASGTPCAVPDACPHRNAPLSLGRVRPDGRLQCAYHGWHFDGTGAGVAPSQPTLRCATRAYRVVERERYLWLAAPETPLAQLAAPSHPDHVLAAVFTTPFETPLHVALDNFSEDEHFPYVHAFLGWREQDWPDVRFEAHTYDDHTEATYVGPQRPSPLLGLVGVHSGDWFHNHFESRFDPVRHVYTSYWTDRSSGERRPVSTITVVYMLPETEATTRFHTFVYVKVDQAWRARMMEPLVLRFAEAFVRLEWWMDARWVRRIAGTGASLQGLRLGKYDKTVIRNRKLLRAIYFGEPAADEAPVLQVAPAH